MMNVSNNSTSTAPSGGSMMNNNASNNNSTALQIMKSDQAGKPVNFNDSLPEYKHDPPKTPQHILLHYSTFKVLKNNKQ